MTPASDKTIFDVKLTETAKRPERLVRMAVMPFCCLPVKGGGAKPSRERATHTRGQSALCGSVHYCSATAAVPFVPSWVLGASPLFM